MRSILIPLHTAVLTMIGAIVVIAPRHASSADEAPTLLRNGGFEQTDRAAAGDVSAGSAGDWYYVRQGRIETVNNAPQGRRAMIFANATPGRDAQAQQLIRFDGRIVRELDVSLSVRARQLAPGQSGEQVPQVKLVFFDERHTRLGEESLGPWLGTFSWTPQHARLTAPGQARMALVYVGLLGGTGELAVDDLRIRPARSNPSVLPARPHDTPSGGTP